MPRRVEFGASTFCASCYANEQCGANGLPLTPNSIRILGRFQKLKSVEHSNLCAYVDLVRIKHERVIVVSEHYEENLSHRIKSSLTDRSVAVASRLAYDVLSGLSYMNSLGLVHRNLSPSSMLFDHQGSVKLAKYGLYHMTGYGTDVSFPIGLPKYLAPEVLCTSVRNEPFHFDDDGCVYETFQDTSFIFSSSPRSDVWSFGLILLEFLLGQFLWEKLSLRQVLSRVLVFLQTDVHPLDIIVRDHQLEEWIETLSPDLMSLLKTCLAMSPSDRPLPSELLKHSLFADMKPCEVGGWSTDLQMFSTNVRCLNLQLPSCDEAFADSDDDVADDASDLLSRRHVSEIYYLWKLAGGDLEGSLRKAGLIRQHPPITQLPSLVIDDGESFGETRDSSSLFDDTVVMLSQDQLRQRLKDIDPTAYYPLLENDMSTAVGSAGELPHSQSASDLQECTRLPLVIRERDVEYQFHRVVLFERLLKAYPYKRQQILQEARVDIPPLFRSHVWAALLQVEGDIALQYDAIDKESPIATDRQIEVDIPRCHQYNELLSSPVGHAKFKRLLKAWVVSHPEYVYWQGLDSLSAPFLCLNFNNEALAFACLTAFIPKYLHNFFLKDNAPIIQEYLSVFSHLIAFHEPQLSTHLDSIGFIPDLYAIPWFLTMYAHVFPLHKIFHLWDMLLLGNSSFPLCIGVAILRQLRGQLVKFGFNECILLFSDMPEIDIEKCVQDSIKIFCSTPKSATFRQHAWTQKNATQRKALNSYYVQDYHETPKTELSMEPIPPEELKAERFPRISAEDLIELCELSGPSKAPNPAKSSKSSKPLIVVVDVRGEDEYKRGAVPRSVNIPFHNAFNADGSLVACPPVTTLNQHRNQVKVVVGGSRGNHASQFAESLIRLGYNKVCVLHKGIDVLRATRLLTVPTPDL